MSRGPQAKSKHPTRQKTMPLYRLFWESDGEKRKKRLRKGGKKSKENPTASVSANFEGHAHSFEHFFVPWLRCTGNFMFTNKSLVFFTVLSFAIFWSMSHFCCCYLFVFWLESIVCIIACFAADFKSNKLIETFNIFDTGILCILHHILP